jgi:general secretion pathway protein A
MYEQFFNFLGLREDPFHVSPDPRYFYTTPSHETALAELLYGIETRKGFLILTGEAGTGKTSLLKQILDWLKGRGRSTAYIFHTHVEPIGLLRLILSDFGVPCHSRSKSELVNALHSWLLHRHKAGDLPVLILDEAQALPLHALDELRLLLNLETPRGKLLQIVLSGQPELEEKLRLPELRQLRQRIVFHSRLSLLTQKETAGYISRRLEVAGCPDSLLFPDEVVHDIHSSSGGIPRVVNLLCEHALISAYAARQHVVSPEMIQRVAVDFDLIERPLAVPESERRAQYARTARFPLLEESESSNQPDHESRRWLEQIEFGVSKPPLGELHRLVQPTAKNVAIGGVLSAAPVEPPKSSQQRTKTSFGHNSSGIRPYWHNHRSRSVVIAFARKSVASLRRTWHAWKSRFDHSKARLAEMFKRAQLAAKESLAAQVISKALVESPKPVERRMEAPTAHTSGGVRRHWHPHRSRSVVSTTATARRSVASVRRGWHAATHPFFSYTHSVLQSFIKDCQSLFHGMTPPTPALETGSSGEGGGDRRSNRRVLAPVINWFRQPMSAGRISANHSSPRRARSDRR